MSTEKPAKAKMGAPTKFKPEYAEQLLAYFSMEPYKEIECDIVTKSGDVVKIFKDVVSDFPSLAGFAIQIEVDRSTLAEWASKTEPEYADFSRAYKRAKDFQENWILINGNRDLIPAAFGIFTAKNVLGYRDKQKDEVDVVVNNIPSEKVTDDDLDKRIEEKLGKLSKAKK